MSEYLSQCYNEHLHCDAKIVCRDKTVLPCHKLVLASLSDLLRLTMIKPDQDCDAVIILPDVDSNDMVRFLDYVYHGDKINSSIQRIVQVLDVELAVGLNVDEDVDDYAKKAKKEDDNYSMANQGESDCDISEIDMMSEDSTNEGQSGRSKKKDKKARKRKGDRRTNALKWDQLMKHRRKMTLNKLPYTVQAMIAERVEYLNNALANKDTHLTVETRQTQESLIVPRYPNNDIHFMAILGVCKSSYCIEATPIVWSQPDVSKDTVTKFKAYGDALKEVFGMNDLDVYGLQTLKHCLGLKYQNFQHEKSVIAKEPPEQLLEFVNSQEMTEAAKSSTPKPAFLQGCEEEVVLHLSDHVKPENMEGLLLLEYDLKDNLFCHCLQTSYGKSKEVVCAEFIKLFFKVLLLQTANKFPEQDEELIRLSHEYSKMRVRYELASELLKDPSKHQKMKSGEQCQECGKMVTKRQASRHKMDHFYSNFACDCPVTWKSLAQKKHHVLLVHREGYQK